MIDKATVQRIMDTADIVEVVSDYVRLVRRGQNFMGLCPFHNEKTPSFSVNKQKNFCFCFSCHKGGSPVNFIMQKEGLSYRDALLHLANRYGIKVEEKEMTDEERARQTVRESLLTVNEWAMRKMQEWLMDTDEGRAVGLSYFDQRGVTEEARKAFCLGYALEKPSQSLVSAARADGYDLELLHKVGLVGRSQQGREYDRFYGRVIFPILSTAGKVIAFGGRDLKGGLSKYINSPESEIYRKSNELYGIYQAKTAIKKEDKCFLVEGYMDVIGMWQCGMKNVVASSGTALTDGQIALIHRFTDNVTLIYDGDNAGIKAALRGMDMLLAHKMKVNVLLLPDGHDPDSFAKTRSAEEFREYVKANETDVVRFKTNILLQNYDGSPQRRTEIIRSVVDTLASIPEQIERQVYIQECSRLLNIPEDLITRETAKQRRLLMEKEKRQREYSRLDQEDQQAAQQQQPQPVQPGQQSQTPATAHKPVKKRMPLAPYEREVVRYCMKYGMAPFCSGVDEEGNVLDISVHQFIQEELESDSVDFTVPVYGRCFRMIGEMAPEYRQKLEAFEQKLYGQMKQRREEAYREFVDKGLDTAAIEQAEKALESAIAQEEHEARMNFMIDYPGTALASHEDDEVRHVAIEMLAERYQLSKIHMKSGPVETEFDRILQLVPRAICEWKDGIITQRLEEVMAEIKEVTSIQQYSHEQLQQLQQKMNRLLQMRKAVGKSIGERIISPIR